MYIKCNSNKKIPFLMLRFIFLQRNFNLGNIGAIDKTITKELNVKAELATEWFLM